MDISKLNDKQREAVTCTEGPLLILAGAGSGKTQTMTHRIGYLMEEKGVDPHRILAVTFTNKAASEMRERITDLCGSRPGLWVMTFHAMCLRILHVHADRVGYQTNFAVYDTQDQKSVLKSLIQEKNLNKEEYKPSYLQSVISDKKEKAIGADEWHDAANDRRNKILAELYRAYEKRLHDNNAMDFDDLLLNTVKLFRQNKDVLASYQDRFSYIMVDEYQDTNHLQYLLVRSLAAKSRNLCVVGDDDQCIYEWRGADIRNILDFERDFPDARVVKLEQNYRSCGHILDTAYSVIKNNKGRKPKKLWTARSKGDKVTYRRLENEKEEAAFVAGEIERGRRAQNRSYADFAVLYRVNAQSRSFEQAFTALGIPYRVLSGLRYYDRQEIKDLLAYLRLVENPADALSFHRIINAPKRGMGPKTLARYEAEAAAYHRNLTEALTEEGVLKIMPAKVATSLREMGKTLEECREEMGNLLISDIYDRLLVKTGYLSALESEGTVEAESRIENLMEFKSAIRDYEEANEEPSLHGFLEQIALMADVDRHDASEDAVVLMTMHSAKGLEFPIVFMPGMEDGLFPGSRSFDAPEQMEEERRLCYVGMTRAREKLYLTGASVRTMYGRMDYTRESTFLREIDPSLLEGDAVYVKRQGLFGYDQNISGPGRSTEEVGPFLDPGMAAYMPFDALRKAKEESREAVNAVAVSYKPGDRVSHRKFGPGLVIEADDKIVRVIFDSVGEKKLAKGLAPLKLL